MSVLAPGRNLVLAGLMGSGKSTVGRLVAERLRRPFVDTDAQVEQEQGRSIAEIFAADGEPAFRAAEAQVIRHVSVSRGQVIAIGGGAVLDAANVRSLRATGDIVVLDAPDAELAARVDAAGAVDRPLLDGHGDLPGRLASLRAERAAAYRDAADAVVDTSGRAPHEVAEQVLGWARARPGLLDETEARA